MKTKYIIGVIAVILLTIGGWFIIKNNPVKTLPTSLDAAFADSIRRAYNAKEKQWEASRLGYEATEKELRSFLKEKDKQLYELAKNPKVRDVTKTVVEIKRDTTVETIIDSSGIRYATVADEWSSVDIVSRIDSTSIKQHISLPLTIKKEFDGRITVATPVPYISINEIRGFTKVEPSKKKNWKYIVGGIVGGVLVYGVSR